MPRVDTSISADAQKLEAQLTGDGYETRSPPRHEAASQARPTASKESGGGNLGGPRSATALQATRTRRRKSS